MTQNYTAAGGSYHHLSASVQSYAPELEKRCRPHLKAGNDSWRVDETSIKGATRTWLLTLSEAKEMSSLVGLRLSPKSLMATGFRFWLSNKPVKELPGQCEREEKTLSPQSVGSPKMKLGDARKLCLTGREASTR